MGADGSVSIYDLDKFYQLEPEKGPKFIKAITDSVTYVQEFEGRKLLTDYRGDNLCTDSTLYQIGEICDWNKSPNWEVQNLLNNGWNLSELSDLRQTLLKCHITDWEVWT